jgi:phosphoribosylanthranilate isomerase
MRAPRRTIVKVCGLTSLDDARDAHEAGADWLGFIVKGESPRWIDAEAAGSIAAGVTGATLVAVMVAPTPAEAVDLARRAGATRVQLHRVDARRWPSDFPLPVTFAVGVDSGGALQSPLPGPRHLVMLDHADARRAGGTGETFPWEAAEPLARIRDVLLAGGLGPDNVADAIARVRPFGVDASSRLERAPGIKDRALVRRFVAAVKECDERSDLHA